MPHQDQTRIRWLSPILVLAGLGLIHAVCSIAFFAAAFEQPPGNAWVYWPGLALVASAWGLWWRAWWARRWAMVGCGIVLASPVLLWGAIEVGPYGGGLVLVMLTGYLLAAVPAGIGLRWLARLPQGALFRERRRGFRWTTPFKVLAVLVLVMAGIGLHAARPIEAYFANLGDRTDREAADVLVRDLVAAVRSGDMRRVDAAEQAIADSKSGGQVAQTISEMFPVPLYPNPKSAEAIAAALLQFDGRENAEVRLALLRALDRCRSGRGDFAVQQTILELVDNEDADVRSLAVDQAGGIIFQEHAMLPMLRRLRDPGEIPATRAKAAGILARIAREPAHVHLRPTIVACLHLDLGTDVLPVREAVIDALAAIDPRELTQAVQAGTLGIDGATSHLLAVLGGDDSFSRLRAAEALGQLGPAARPALAKLEEAFTKTTNERERTALRKAIETIEGAAAEAPVAP